MRWPWVSRELLEREREEVQRLREQQAQLLSLLRPTAHAHEAAQRDLQEELPPVTEEVATQRSAPFRRTFLEIEELANEVAARGELDTDIRMRN